VTSMRPTSGTRTSSLAVAAVCVLAAGATFRLALGETAVRFGYVPGFSAWRLPVDPGVYERLAEQEIEQDGETAQAFWQEAARLNPRSSRAWIALGLAAERGEDFAEAERHFLKAAEVDRQYLPAWTLANFYFRRGDRQDFRPWARLAAARCYGDMTPLIKLCDRMDPGRLGGLGDSSVIDRTYLDLLIHESRLDDAQRVARKMLARDDSRGTDVPRLMAFTSLQIAAGNAAAAREIWKGLFPASSTLTNGDFRVEPTGEGFDWKVRATSGIRSQWRESRIRFFLSGNQPETCTLLDQPMELEARHYRLRFASSILGRDSPFSGLRWAIESNALLAAESPQLDETRDSTDAAWTFRVPVRGLARLSLFYRREPGSAASELEVEIREVRIEPF
jgi:tetratricopeptide (TPR) repeat protein